jgi:hypothetical protein
MSVIRQQNWLGQQRVDLPHLRSLESSIAADFDVLVGQGMAGDAALILRGFEMTGIAVGAPATSLSVVTASGIVFNRRATEAGTFLSVPANRAAETLNPVTNSRVVGGWVLGATNYIGLDFTREADATTTDLVQFISNTTRLESPRQVPLGKTLDYQIEITAVPFGSQVHLIPVAKVVLDASGFVVSVEDARPLMFRLGSGGDNPQPSSSFSLWTRTEGGSIIDNTLFQGGDKAVTNLKSWMDAVMTRIWESSGGEHWYSATADRNVTLITYGSPLASGEYFSWNLGTETLTWQGLRLLFDNSTSYNADIANGSVAGLKAGEVLYVDADRTKFYATAWAATTAYVAGDIVVKSLLAYEASVAGTSGGTGPSGTGTAIVDGTVTWKYVGPGVAGGLTPAKAALGTLGTGSPAGSRWILAWRRADQVFVRGWRYPVGTLFTPATTAAQGVLKISRDYAGTNIGAVSALNNPIAISDRGGIITTPLAAQVGLGINAGASAIAGLSVGPGGFFDTVVAGFPKSALLGAANGSDWAGVTGMGQSEPGVLGLNMAAPGALPDTAYSQAFPVAGIDTVGFTGMFGVSGVNSTIISILGSPLPNTLLRSGGIFAGDDVQVDTAGVVGLGGLNGGIGVYGVATGSGASTYSGSGVVGLASGGAGLFGDGSQVAPALGSTTTVLATASAGVRGRGGGTGAGVVGLGGATNGPGGQFSAGASGGSGVIGTTQNATVPSLQAAGAFRSTTERAVTGQSASNTNPTAEFANTGTNGALKATSAGAITTVEFVNTSPGTVLTVEGNNASSQAVVVTNTAAAGAAALFENASATRPTLELTNGTTGGTTLQVSSDGPSVEYMNAASNGPRYSVASGGKALKKILGGGEFVLSTAVNGAPNVTLSSVGPSYFFGVTFSGGAGNANWVGAFNLPLNARIDSVRVCLDHSGTGAGVALSAEFLKIATTATNWAAASFAVGGAFALNAAATVEVKTPVNGALADRTVNNTTETFAIALAATGTTATTFVRVRWVEINYTMFDTLTW